MSSTFQAGVLLLSASLTLSIIHKMLLFLIRWPRIDLVLLLKRAKCPMSLEGLLKDFPKSCHPSGSEMGFSESTSSEWLERHPTCVPQVSFHERSPRMTSPLPPHLCLIAPLPSTHSWHCQHQPLPAPWKYNLSRERTLLPFPGRLLSP